MPRLAQRGAQQEHGRWRLGLLPPGREHAFGVAEPARITDLPRLLDVGLGQPRGLRRIGEVGRVVQQRRRYPREHLRVVRRLVGRGDSRRRQREQGG